jgi:hypothetical protein
MQSWEAVSPAEASTPKREISPQRETLALFSRVFSIFVNEITKFKKILTICAYCDTIAAH